MGFLKSEIISQKWLEKEVEAAKFIRENSISNDALIYEMHLDKKVFKTEEEAREYLQGKYLSTENIEDAEGMFIAKTLNYSQVDMSTAVKVEIRRGVTAYAADLIRFDVYNFSDKSERETTKFMLKALEFSEKTKDLPQVIELARVVKGNHPSYGDIEITKDHLTSFVTNFNSKVTGTDLAVNEDHKKNEAFGWLKDVFLNDDGDILYGTVSWNAKGTRALSEKEYRYFSPEFRFNYTHPHTQKEHGATLIGGALTNYPFLKMEAIVELSNKAQTPTKDTKVEKIDLSVHTEKVIELSSKITATETELALVKAQNIELSNKVKASEEKAEKVIREGAHKKMFDDGKINAAQLIALNDGKSMLEVLALSAPMNMSGKGTDAGNNSTHTTELNDQDRAVMKEFGLTEEQYRTANKIS